MHRALFVAHKDVANVVLLKNLVIDRQHRTAGIAENNLDPLIFQRLNHHLGAGHRFLCHRLTALDAYQAVARHKKTPSGSSGAG